MGREAGTYGWGDLKYFFCFVIKNEFSPNRITCSLALQRKSQGFEFYRDVLFRNAPIKTPPFEEVLALVCLISTPDYIVKFWKKSAATRWNSTITKMTGK
jgi:hypothetical protein